MLVAKHRASTQITDVKRTDKSVVLRSKAEQIQFIPISESAVRVICTKADTQKKEQELTQGDSIKRSNQMNSVQWELNEDSESISVILSNLTIRIDRQAASISYYKPNGELLLKERDKNSRTMEAFQSYRVVRAGKIEQVQTADGLKRFVKDAVREPDQTLYHTRIYFKWKQNEALYGLGQHEEGIFNLRGHMVYLHQANRKIAIPLLMSSLGYGILMNTSGNMIFSDTEHGSYLYTESDPQLDFYFINGDGMDGVVKEYRQLTGKASMLPRWAFGYLQSQERYETQEEISQVAAEYRRRGIGLDGIVLDWCSWEDGMWGQKSFDASRFPDPTGMIQTLHDEDVHFMISIWPNMDEKCENYKEMKEKGFLLPFSNIYDARNEQARKCYWEQVKRGLYRYGVDAWWCDSSEPFTPEWSHVERQEPASQYEEYKKTAGEFLGEAHTNDYALYHARAIYEGQRAEQKKDGSNKRVFNLTRSAWTGQQQYGTVMWSGDTSASWETFRRQIPAGLNFCASGLPYWTADIGAFFVKDGDSWYWDGKYDDTTNDPAYLELYTRWYQWCCFLPIFRGHGTDCRRELWKFDGEGGMFYQALLRMNALRYKLLPYIYSTAGKVWLYDSSMIRMLAFDFPKDQQALHISNQYLFGESLMVCPVTRPMYYQKNENGTKKILNPYCYRAVYLPEGCGWYNFWTNKYYEGGQWIEAEAPIEKIPLFVKEGSILPIAKPAQSVEEVVASNELTFFVYTGKDCSYELYHDDGDGYEYENGAYKLDTYKWNQREQKLIGPEGTFIKKENLRIIGRESLDENRDL